jgi:hypothetical protein
MFQGGGKLQTHASIARTEPRETAQRDARRLARSACIESPEHLVDLRPFGLTVFAVATAPDFLDHTAIERHYVVVVIQEELRRAARLQVRGFSIIAESDPSAREGALERAFLRNEDSMLRQRSESG